MYSVGKVLGVSGLAGTQGLASCGTRGYIERFFGDVLDRKEIYGIQSFVALNNCVRWTHWKLFVQQSAQNVMSNQSMHQVHLQALSALLPTCVSQLRPLYQKPRQLGSAKWGAARQTSPLSRVDFSCSRLITSLGRCVIRAAANT